MAHSLPQVSYLQLGEKDAANLGLLRAISRVDGYLGLFLNGSFLGSMLNMGPCMSTNMHAQRKGTRMNIRLDASHSYHKSLTWAGERALVLNAGMFTS